MSSFIEKYETLLKEQQELETTIKTTHGIPPGKDISSSIKNLYPRHQELTDETTLLIEDHPEVMNHVKEKNARLREKQRAELLAKTKKLESNNPLSFGRGRKTRRRARKTRKRSRR